MQSMIELGGKVKAVEKAELHLPLLETQRYMYLSVDAESELGGFFLWEIPLPLLSSLDNLDGQRIHIKPNGESFDDDTLGADIIAAYHSTDMNYWHGYPDEEDYSYGEILIDFQRIEGMKYHVCINMTLTDSEEVPADLPPEAFNVIGKAEFDVTIDQNDPYSESLKTSENVSD